jgi:hypothetical protein
VRFPVPVGVPVCVPIPGISRRVPAGMAGTETWTAAGATSPSRSCVPIRGRASRSSPGPAPVLRSLVPVLSRRPGLRSRCRPGPGSPRPGHGRASSPRRRPGRRLAAPLGHLDPILFPVPGFLAGFRPGWPGRRPGPPLAPHPHPGPASRSRRHRPEPRDMHRDGAGIATPVLVAGPGRPWPAMCPAASRPSRSSGRRDCHPPTCIPVPVLRPDPGPGVSVVARSRPSPEVTGHGAVPASRRAVAVSSRSWATSSRSRPGVAVITRRRPGRRLAAPGRASPRPGPVPGPGPVPDVRSRSRALSRQGPAGRCPPSSPRSRSGVPPIEVLFTRAG